MIVKGATFRARNFFLLVGRFSGAFPSYRKLVIYSKSLGVALTRNKCVSGRSSSMPIGSSPISSHDRWLGRTFFFPGHMIMSDSNS